MNGKGVHLYWDGHPKNIGDGKWYMGQWVRDDTQKIFEGFGKITLLDGSVYIGLTINGLFQGKGCLRHSNGDTYIG